MTQIGLAKALETLGERDGASRWLPAFEGKKINAALQCYARVSPGGKNESVEAQARQLTKAGCKKVFGQN